MADTEAKPADAPAPAASAPGSSPAAGEGRARRERKQVEHFKPAVVVKEDFVIRQGAGTQLGDIPNVRFRLSKMKPDAEMVMDMHRLLYQRPGTVTKRKRDVLEFSGFPWRADETEKETPKAVERADKLKSTSITAMLDLFDLPKDGNKLDKANRLVNYLIKPKDEGKKDLAALAEKKRDAKKRKAERSAKKAAKKGKKASAQKAPAKKAGAKEESEDDEDDESEEDEESEDKDEEESEEEPIAKKAKKEPTPKKVPPAKKVTPAKKNKAEASNDEGDEEPEPPTDEELKAEIKGIVAEVNLEQFSFKSLMKKLTAKFPGVAEKKAFVKEYVTEVVQSATAANKPAEADAEGQAEVQKEEETAKPTEEKVETAEEKAETAEEKAETAEEKAEPMVVEAEAAGDKPADATSGAA